MQTVTVWFELNEPRENFRLPEAQPASQLDSGTEWLPGDRASLARRAIRQAAIDRPAAFMVEFSTEPYGLRGENDKR